MQKRLYSPILSLLLVLLLLAPGAGLADTLTSGVERAPVPPEEALAQAWARVRDAGSYRFLSTVDQTLTPRAIPEMIGRSGVRFTIESGGAVILPDRAYMELRLAGGNATAFALPERQGTVALLRDGNQAFLLQNGELQPVQDPLSLAAPTNDMLGYLAAAEQVTEIAPPEGHPTLARYGFALNGERLAEYARQQAEAALRAEPGAPEGISVKPAAALQKISGHGELWVNEDGLPVRQVLDIEVPEINKAYSARLHMVVDLTSYGQVSELPRAVQGADGTWELGGTEGTKGTEGTEGLERTEGTLVPVRTEFAMPALPSDPSVPLVPSIPSVPTSSQVFARLFPLQIPPSLAAAFMLCLLALLFFRYYRRQPKQAYRLIAVTLIIIIVGGPLLQTAGVVRFVERQARAAESRAAATPALLQALGLAVAEEETLTPPAEASPAAGGTEETATALPTATATMLPTETSPTTTASLLPSPTPSPTGATLTAIGPRFPAGRAQGAPSLQAAAEGQLPHLSRCGQGEPGVDTDGDGVTDQTELCLGTDPHSPDTDSDGISDRVELEGFELGGKHWYSDPLHADSNRDGMPDAREWSQELTPDGRAENADLDGDMLPNLWDDDDDGDNVPDALDLSPFALSGYTSELTLSTEDEGFAGSQTIEIEIQPEDPAHLRYSTTALDWPADDKGNVQDLDGSTEDLRLTPFLLVTTNVQPAEEMAEAYGFRSWADGDGYVLLVPLQPLEDGGAVYAFYGKVAYAPGQTDDIQWQAKLVWLAQMQADRYQGDTLQTDTRLLHQYRKSFRLTGLQIARSQDYEALVLGTPAEADDRYLFQLLVGLNSTLMQYETLEGQEAGETALEEIGQRFAPGSGASDTHTFGIPANTVATSGPQVYRDLDAGLFGVGSALVPDFLADNSLHYSSGEGRCRDGEGNPVHCATLLLASEHNESVQDLREFTRTDARTVDLSQLHVNLAGVPLFALRGVSLRMYEQDASSDEWQVVTPARMLELIEARYSGVYDSTLADLYPNLRAQDARFIAYTSYLWGYGGRTAVVAVDGQVLLPEVADEAELALQNAVDQAFVDNAIDYMGLASNLPDVIGDSNSIGQGIFDIVELGADWANLSKGGRIGQGTLAGFGLAATAASLIMGSINTACSTNESLPGCGNEKALLVANSLVTSFVIAMQTISVTVEIIETIAQFLDDALEKTAKSTYVLGAIGTGIGVTMAWVSFGIAAGTSGGDPVVLRVALGMAIMTTIWLTVLFLIEFIPVVGPIISTILSVIDTILSFFTGLFADEEWSIAKVFLELFYSAETLTTVQEASFGEFSSGLTDPDRGLVGGNTLSVSIPASGVIKREAEGEDDDLRQSYVEGRLIPSPLALWSPDAFSVQDMSQPRDCRIIDDELHCNNTAMLGFALTPKINGRASFSASLLYQTVWAEYALFGSVRYKTHKELGSLPESDEENEPSDLYLDVVPATLSDLWSWTALVNPDRDGDGLSNAQEAELGTAPDRWDTDGDGLSDYYEWQTFADRGADPLKADTDGDGLHDGLERRVGTRADVADTDGDGLTDGEEVCHLEDGALVGGWLVTPPAGTMGYVAAGGTAWVSSDPLAADDDADGLNAAEEKRNGLSPHAINDPVPGLRLTAGPLRGVPGGRAGLYLEPGDTVALTIELANTATAPVTGTLALALPAWLSNIEGGQMQGNRTPPRQKSGNTLTWSFAGANSLQLLEVVSTTVTARVNAGATSASGEISLDLPYGRVALHKAVDAVVDGDNPSVAVLAPADGAFLRGTSYVVGGAASDPTTWVTGVGLSIGGSSYQTLSGSTSPWAYTWNLPADGHYTLRARTADAMGHTSTSAVDVTVDNTAPSTTLTVNLSGDAVQLNGAATDNLAGIERVEIAIDGQPWRSVSLSGSGTTSASWTYDWTVGPQAQGRHEIRVRALDRAGNGSEVLSREIVVDRVAPASDVTGGADAAVPPAVKAGSTFTLTGVADEGGHLPDPAAPADLRTGMDVLTDSTVWLGLSSIRDNDGGVLAAWVGDFDADRLADLAVGLPGPNGDSGQVSLLYGRAGGWPAPPDLEMLAAGRTRFVGVPGARLGSYLAAAGDVNGDHNADLLIGERTSDRAFLVFGNPGPLGEVTLDGGKTGYRSLLRAPARIERLAGAGDVDGDGLDDLLVTAGGAAYLLRGRANPWPETVDVAAEAVATQSGVTGAVGVGDADGDHLANWVTLAHGRVTLYRWDGAAGMPVSVASFTTADAAPRVAALGDVNGDGKADWLYGSGANRTLVYGQGPSSHAFSGYDGFFAAPGDVDGDGRADILLSTAAGVASLIRQQVGESPEVFATVQGVAGAANAPYAAGADVNADGSSDLLLIPSRAAAEGGGYDAPDFSGGFVSPQELPQGAPLGTQQAGAHPVYSGRLAMAGKADTLYVDDDHACGGNTPCYTSIQTAVNAADSAGDTIIVYPGVYKGFSVPPGKDHLTVQGLSPDAVFVEGDAAGGRPDAVRITGSDGVRVSNLTLRHAAGGVVLEDGAGAPSVAGGSETRIDHIVAHSVQQPITMSQGAALSMSDSTLVGDGTRPILGVDPTASSSVHTWNHDRAVALPATAAEQPIAAHGALLAAGNKLYAIPGGQSRAVYAATPGAGGALGDWAQPFSLQHDLPYSTGTPSGAPGQSALAAGGSYLHQVQSRVQWPALGGAFNGAVRAVAVAANGDIYAGGDFTQIGSLEVYHVARWDGTEWHALGEGMNKGTNGPVYAIAMGTGSNVYIGGAFTKAGLYDMDHVVRWDGANWQPLGAAGSIYKGEDGEPVNGVDGPVYALAWAGHELIVGGDFDQVTWDASSSPYMRNIAKWKEGCNLGLYPYCWSRMNTGVNGTVYGLTAVATRPYDAASGTSLYTVYAVGDFTHIYQNDGNTPASAANRIARFTIERFRAGADDRDTDTYLAMGDGLPGQATTVTVDPTTMTWNNPATDVVYAACESSGSTQVYRWDPASSQWAAVSGLSSASGIAGLAADGDGNVYAAAGQKVYVQTQGNTGFQTLGTESRSGATVGHAALCVDGAGHVYTGYGIDKSGVLSGAVSRWVLEGYYRRDVASGSSWVRLAYPPVPSPSQAPASLAADDDGNLYALWGQMVEGCLYRYDRATGAWARCADPYNGRIYTDLLWAGGKLYALSYVSSTGVWYCESYDPATNVWSSRARPPLPNGSNVSVGLSWAWDGGDCIYLLGRGGRDWMRYRISADDWDTLPAPSSFTLAEGPAMARVGSDLYVYGTPGTGVTTNLFRYGAVGMPDLRLTVERTAFVAPASASSFAWTNLSATGGSYRFGADIAITNAWVGPASAAWSPALPAGASPLTAAQAAFVAPEDGLYRLGAGSGLLAGYHQYQGEAHVYVSQAACARCAAGGDLTWGETAFGTVREAVESGAARVRVHAGRYPQPFYLVSGVEVIGAGAESTIIEAPAGGSGTLVTAEGVAHAGLARLTLAGSPGWQGLLAEGGAQGLSLTRCIVRDLGTGVRLREGSDVALLHNTIVRNGDGYVAEGTNPVNVRNTILAFNTGTGLKRGASPASLANTYNAFYANGTDMSPVDTGGGIVFFDPRFQNMAADDYRLAAGSRLIDAGAPGDPSPPGTGTRADIGYAEHNAAGFYASHSYSETGLNDGLTWGVEAFATVQDALDAAGEAVRNLPEVGSLRQVVGVAAGTYTETVTVPSHVRLVGSGAEVTTLSAGGTGSAVTFDGVVNAEVSGLTLQGAGASGAGVDVKNAANRITVARNVIRNNAGAGVRFAGRSSGEVRFNTIVNNTGAGVLATDTASWLEAQNNLVDGNAYGLRAASGGLIRNRYNLLHNTTNTDGVTAGEGTVTGAPALAATGHYVLTAGSPALDAADPLAPAPAGGGVRADLGYRELLASPLALLLGPQIASTVTANSGVARVEVGTVAVSDATQPVTATLPTTWQTVTPGTSGRPLFYWRQTVSAGSAGYYRVYTRATDANGNTEQRETDWYEGAFIVDNTAPTLSWLTAPASSEAAAVQLRAQATGSVSTGAATRYDVTQVYFEVTGPGGTVTYPGDWETTEGTARTFAAWVPLPQNGSYTITAVAADEAGNVGRSTARTLIAGGAGHVVAVTSHVDGGAVSSSTVILRGYARFAMGGEGSVAVSVGGSTVQATLDAPAETLSAWTAAITLPETQGAHSITLTPSGGGLAGTATTISLTLDKTAPTLSVTSPAAGARVTQAVSFAGTASDSGSGLAAVSVSVDGGYTWRPATLNGGAWSLSWDLGTRQDFASYPAQVRAVDAAGNVSAADAVITVDSVPPTGLAPVSFSAPEGQHVEVGSSLNITWTAPVDNSGTADVLLAVDRSATTEPTSVVSGASAHATLNATGDWYVHLAAEDAGGNRFTRHYGPWHVRDTRNSSFAARRQSIIVDGYLDVDHAEWSTASEELDSDTRYANRPQRLLTTWDGQAIYLGWMGAWWTLDGTLWAYLDARTGGSHTGVDGTALPSGLAADVAVQIDGPASGKLWTYNGSWQAGTLEFANGPSGDTELRIPWAAGGSQALRLVAFALPRADDTGTSRYAHPRARAAADPQPRWAVFPTTNGLEGALTESYEWSGVGAVDSPNAGQPQTWGVALSAVSPQPAGTAWGPGAVLEYRISVQNQEAEALSGLQITLQASPGLSYQSWSGANCPGCSAGSSTLTLQAPLLAAGATRQVTVTARLAGSLSGVNAVTSTIGLNAPVTLNGAPVRALLSHRVDSAAPTVTIDALPGGAIGPGAQTVTGTAHDGAGSGVARVEVSVNGGASWQAATGQVSWSATVHVPAGGTMTVQARAIDHAGYTGSVASRTLNVDTVAPQVNLAAPAVITRTQAVLNGTASDPAPSGGRVTQVAVQIDDAGGAWQPATSLYKPVGGVQGWALSWNTRGDGETHQLRARAVDAVGNTTLTGWHSTIVDTVAPAITVTQQISEVIVADYMAIKTVASALPVSRWGGAAILSLEALATTPVLRGVVSDGAGVQQMRARLYTPGGETLTQAVERTGATWRYSPALGSALIGRYTLWIEALDVHGNLRVSGPYDLLVRNEALAGLTASNDSPTDLHSATTLTATVSAGTNVSYTWDLGDGTIAYGAVVSHIYPAVGAYTAVVTAGNDINTLTASTVVTIAKPTGVFAVTPLSATVPFGEHRVFQLTYTNTTAITLHDVQLAVTAPAGATVMAGESSSGLQPGPGFGQMIWQLGEVAPDQQVTRELALLFMPDMDKGTQVEVPLAAYAAESEALEARVTVQVIKQGTAIALSAAPGSPVYGQAITLTAQVTPAVSVPGVPAGTVTFLEGSTTLGTGALVNGVARLTVTGLGAGSHTLTAAYGGNSSFEGSTSSALALSVSKASLTVRAEDKSKTYGAALPALSVRYSGFVWGDDESDLSGAPHLSTTATQWSPARTYPITVTAGTLASPNYRFTFVGGTLTVEPADTATQIIGEPAPCVYGQTVVLTATVQALAPGGGTPAGAVTFRDGSTVLGTVTLEHGRAVYSTSALSVGTHTLTAAYAGEENFAPSSGSVSQDVRPIELALSKSDGLDDWYATWNYAYTIVVTNTSPAAATGVVITDSLPAQVYPVSLPAGAAQGPDGAVTWQVGPLEAGRALTLTLEVRTLSTVRGAITNLAAVSCTGGLVITATDTTTITVPPAGAPTPTPTVTGTPAPTATATPEPTATPIPEDLVLTGAVTEETAGEPLPGAQVTVLLCKDVFSSVTGDDGRYELAIPAVDLEPCSELTFQVTAPGYGPVQQTFAIDELRAQPVRDWTLAPLSGGKLWLPYIRAS